MNSRERVLAALNHREPDRVPVDLGGFTPATSMNVEAYRRLLERLGIRAEVRIGAPLMFTAEIGREVQDRLDVDTCALNPSVALSDFGSSREFVDPVWKVTWRRSSDCTYAPVDGPFFGLDEPTPDDVERYPWPLPHQIENPDKWRAKGRQLRQETDRALVARVMPGIGTIAQFIRGMENWMVDLAANPEFSVALHEKLAGLWIESTEGVLGALGDNVDVVMFGDDFGLQSQPIMRPEMFRERFKPLMTRMVRHAKSLTRAKIAIHSCGSVYALVDDFVDIGIDVLNPLQANAADMEPERIKAKAGKRLALWGGIDTHGVLPHGTPEDVRREVAEKLPVLGRGGGYILAADHNILIDVPVDNVLALFEADRKP